MCVYITLYCSMGLAGIRDTDNDKYFNNPLVVVYFNIDYTHNAKGSNYWRNRLNSLLFCVQYYPGSIHC